MSVYKGRCRPEMMISAAVWDRLFALHDDRVEFDTGNGIMATMWYHKILSGL